MAARRPKNGITRVTTNRLKKAYGKEWRRHYVPQLPPPTPLGAIWRVVLEQADLWPGPGGLPLNKKAVFEDMYPNLWVEDATPFCLLIGRYPPAMQKDGTYAAGREPDVRRETARIKGKMYTQPRGRPARSGWAGVLFGTAELFCSPPAWTPTLAAAWAATGTLDMPTPRQVGQQFLGSPDIVALPTTRTEDASDCDDLAALTFFTWGITFEQMAQAHATLPPATLGSQRTAGEFEAAAARAITKALGTATFYIWAVGIDATQLPITQEDGDLLNHGMKPNWDTSARNRAYHAARKHIAEFTARRRPPNLPSPVDGCTWASVDEAIKDPASHLAHAYSLWSACSQTIRRTLDLTARPANPEQTPIPVLKTVSISRQAPFPLSLADTKAKIVRFLAETPAKSRYKLTRGLV